MTLNDNRLEVFKSIVNERSHWKWFDTDKSIPDDLLKDVMRTAQRAPSSFNTQPHKVVIVRDNESKLALAEGMIGDSNKNIVLTADTNAVFLADLEVLLIPLILRHAFIIQKLHSQGLNPLALLTF